MAHETSTPTSDAEEGPSQLRASIGRCFDPADFERCAKAVGLPCDRLKLNEGIIDAAFACFVHHGIITLGPQRASEMRATLAAVGERAKEAACALEALHTAVGEMGPAFRDLLRRHWKLVCGRDLDSLGQDADQIGRLAALAQHYAAVPELRDKGGPSKMAPFDTLIYGLAVAFERAKGEPARVTYNPAASRETQHGGPFLALVEAVLPTMSGLAAAGGQPLKQPANRNACGEYIRKLLAKRRRPAG